jgi:adenine-specific DNA-methyltransferase
VYPDNYREGLATYLEWTRQVNEEGRPLTSNPETGGRYHSNWLNMMYPRIKLAWNLLTKDGLVFISIDGNELDNLHKLCNEVFGERHFVGLITRATGTPTGGGFEGLTNMVDYILVYRRGVDAVLKGLAFGEGDAAIYNEGDDDGRYLTRSLRRTGGEDRREDRPSMFYAVEAPDGTQVYPIGPSGYESRWSCGKERYLELLSVGHIEWKQVDRGGNLEWHPYQKFFLDGREKRPSNLWTNIDGNKKGTREIRALFDQEKVFDSPKPVALIQRIVQIATDSDSIVLDFFSGSGTTAHAVMLQNAEDGGNRKHIQVQLPEPTPEDSAGRRLGFRTIAEISRRRIDLAGRKIADSLDTSQIDIGFRAYRLCDTNFAKWRVSSDTDRTALEQHLLDLRESARDDATADDLLTEVLLKQGHSLSEKIVDANIEGLPVKVVGEQLIIAYLDETVKPTLAQLRALVAQDPQRIIVLEDAFQGDDELKTNLAQLCKSKGIELWTA